MGGSKNPQPPYDLRILVCGSRTYSLDFVMPALLKAYAAAAGTVTIIHGDAPGADRHARDWGHVHGFDVEPYPADWDNCGPECDPGHRKVNRRGDEYCPTAGHRRNQRMLDEGKPDMVLAFVDKPLAESKGTADMVRRARKAGVPVYVVGAS